MATTLGELSIKTIEQIVDQLWTDFDGRRTRWSDRRKVRFRQMDKELEALPLSTRAGGQKALMTYQTEEPNQEVHRRVKRLIANKERIEVVIYADDQETKDQAQAVKDALSAIWKWMNRGKIPASRLVTTFQQADGLGVFKLDLVVDYADEALAPFDPDVLEGEPGENESPVQTKARDNYAKAKATYAEDDTDELAPEKAYHDVTHAALRRCDPPFRLSAPDPLTLAYSVDGDTIDTIVEKGTRKLSALLKAFETHRVRLGGDNRLVVYPEGTDMLNGTTIPSSEQLDKKYSDTVDYKELRTRKEIVIMIRQPKLRGRDDIPDKNKEGGWIKITFENPFGPYSTGYVLCPGDISGSSDPADDFQPSILGTLNLAQKINVLTTIRVSAAIDSALAPPWIEAKDAVEPPPQLSQAFENKTPSTKDGESVPIIPGKLQRMASANVDLDKAEQRFMAEESLYRFNEVLAGDASSSDSGHKLAIQVSQADTQLVPYQNTRAEAIAEVLMCILYATEKIGKPIYVKEIPDHQAVLMNKFSNVQSRRVLLPDMFELMQDAMLIVTIGSETPVTKFAKWSALQQRYERGTLSFETLMEQSDVENVADEIARIFEGQTLVAVMQQAIPVVVKMIAQRSIAKLQGGAPSGAGPSDVTEQGGNENGGGQPGAEESLPVNGGAGRLPGVGMNAAGPPEEAANGPQPGGAELAPAGAP
jgi:hypothetical protein